MNIFQVDPYTVETNIFDKSQMRYCESITSLTNGYMGIRGNFEESYSADSLKGTYITGIWFPDKTRVGWWKNGYPEYYGKVINTVNIIGIDVFVEDEEIDLAKQHICEYYLQLDMRTAILRRRAIVKTLYGRVKIESERFLSMFNKNICAIRYQVTPLDKDVKITLTPYMDFNVRNEDTNYHKTFWDIDEQQEDKGYLEGSTKRNPFNTNKFRVGAAMYVKALVNAGEVLKSTSKGRVDNTLIFHAEKGCSVGIEKTVAVNTSNNEGASIKENTISTATGEGKRGFNALRHDHVKAFIEMMDSYDVEITGDDAAQQGIRYNIFQLLSTYDGSDSTLNIGPKGMTGEKYGGAAYWDTEAFLIPFYLGVCSKEVVKNLLLYRFNTLDKAIGNAKLLGLKGALFPMVTFNGHECHNEWEITFEEIHRNGAIAYAIFNYIAYTGDTDYLIKYGFRVLIEIARFWQDRAHYKADKRVYMIHGVTGPNEYENNVNNNWYTNYIAKWCLEYTASVADQYGDRLAADYTSDEIEQFKKIAKSMYQPYDARRKIAVQQDTFLDKDLQGVDALSDEERPIHQHWSWDRILRSCYIKQADVIQGLYFFGHHFDRGFVKRNFDFYEPMTVHESSLSASIHSVVASRIGEKKKAYEFFRKTARLDLDDKNNDTRDGLHITSMSGSWLAVTQGFAGMATITGELKFAPYLPEELEKYAFRVHYRGRGIRVEVSRRDVSITKVYGEDIELSVFNDRIVLSDTVKIPLKG